MELFLECQGMAIECRTGSKPALYRCCEALLFVADWRFWCLAAALFLHLWLLLPYSPVFLSVVMPPVFFFFPSRDLLFFVTAYYSASPSTLPHPHQSPRHWVYFLPRFLPVFSFLKPFSSDLKVQLEGEAQWHAPCLNSPKAADLWDPAIPFPMKAFGGFSPAVIFQDSTAMRVCEGNKQAKQTMSKNLEPRQSSQRPTDLLSCSSLPSKFFWVLNPICSPVVLRCGCWNNHFQVFYPTVLCSGTIQREAFLELQKLLRSPKSPLLRPHRAWSPKNWVVSPEGPKCSNGSWDNFCVNLEALVCLQFVSKLPVELVRVHIPGPYPKSSK